MVLIDEIALSSKVTLRFFDRSYAKPITNANILLHWTRCNDIIISWLLKLFLLKFVKV